jgi:hypothetical protein
LKRLPCGLPPCGFEVLLRRQTNDISKTLGAF